MAFQYRNVYWLWLSAAVMLADQVTKQMIVKYLGWFDVQPVIPHFNLVFQVFPTVREALGAVSTDAASAFEKA